MPGTEASVFDLYQDDDPSNNMMQKKQLTSYSENKLQWMSVDRSGRRAVDVTIMIPRGCGHDWG